MKLSNFMNSLLTNLIPQKNSKLAKISILKFTFKSHASFNTSWIPTNEDSKFKLDCAESENSCILLIDVISFKLRLINFVYIFLRHLVYCIFLIFWSFCKPIRTC